ncbi:MAG: cysteine hydrolase [Gammaproteobacteria bacterium]|nr:cysteine hydrolase [Gammaproteobacteria bacterium]
MPQIPLARVALIVVDVQKGFDDTSYWGPRNNPECENNISTLIDRWRRSGQPIVFVRHDSIEDTSPLRPDAPGNDFKPCISGRPDLLVRKTVNSAFYGEPDLHEWLDRQEIKDLAICGVTTNHCCETTARMAGNLGFGVFFIIDATYTFDRKAVDGSMIPADEIMRVTAANLQCEFAKVISTQQGISMLE